MAKKKEEQAPAVDEGVGTPVETGVDDAAPEGAGDEPGDEGGGDNPDPAPVNKVRVYKIQPDQQSSFCGEQVQLDEEGREFFELADYLKPLVDQHINLAWPE